MSKKDKFTLIDGIIALAIGEMSAWLLAPIFENLSIRINIWWGAVILPIISLVGLFVCYLLSYLWRVFYQFGKFGLVGVLNTLVDWGVLNFLMWSTEIMAGVGYGFFKSISFILATTNSYFWNKFWVFQKNETKLTEWEASKFLAVSVVGFLINVGVASLVVNFVHPSITWKLLGQVNIAAFWGNIGALIGTITAALWNFIGYKVIVFKK